MSRSTSPATAAIATTPPVLYPMIRAKLLPEYDASCAPILPVEATQLLLDTELETFDSQDQLQFKRYIEWKDKEVSVCYEIELSYTAPTWRLVARNMFGVDKNRLWPHPRGADIWLAQVHVDPAVTTLYAHPYHGTIYKDMALYSVGASLCCGEELFIKSTTESGRVGSRLCICRVVGLYARVDGVDTLWDRMDTTVIHK